MKNTKFLLLLALISLALFVGCQTNTAPPTPRPRAQNQIKVPVIEVISDSVNKQTQSKGGLDITVVPSLHKVVPDPKTTRTQVQPSFGEAMLMDANTQVIVETVTITKSKVVPDRVAFTVKIHNQLSRVFHGKGSVVQFNVDGKQIAFNTTDYTEFSGGIVPPRSDNDFNIFGPPLDSLRDKGTISVFVYDVVTATDVAGNTTEKQNYTWDFTYTMQATNVIDVAPVRVRQLMRR